MLRAVRLVALVALLASTTCSAASAANGLVSSGNVWAADGQIEELTVSKLVIVDNLVYDFTYDQMTVNHLTINVDTTIASADIDVADIATLTGGDADITSLTVDELVVNTSATFADATAATFEATALEAGSLHVSGGSSFDGTISASSLSASGTVSAASFVGGSVSASGGITATSAASTITNLDATGTFSAAMSVLGTATVTTKLTVDGSVDAQHVDATSLDVAGTLDADVANVDAAVLGKASVTGTLSAASAVIDSLAATNADVNNLKVLDSLETLPDVTMVRLSVTDTLQADEVQIDSELRILGPTFIGEGASIYSDSPIQTQELMKSRSSLSYDATAVTLLVSQLTVDDVVNANEIEADSAAITNLMSDTQYAATGTTITFASKVHFDEDVSADDVDATSLSVSGPANFDGAVTMQDALTYSGTSAALFSAVQVNNDATVVGTLNADSLNVASGATMSVVTITSSLSAMSATITSLSATSVSASVATVDDLSATGTIRALSIIDVTSIETTSLDATTANIGALTATSGAFETIDASGEVNVRTLHVTQNGLVDGFFDVAGSVDVGGALEAGDTTVDSLHALATTGLALDVDGDAHFDAAIEVDGLAKFHEALMGDDGAVFAGEVQSDTLLVRHDATVVGSLTVDGSSTLQHLYVPGTASMFSATGSFASFAEIKASSKLIAMGDVSIDADITISGTLGLVNAALTSNSDITTSTTVQGAAGVFTSTLDSQGAASFDTITASSATALNGGLTVTSASTFNGDVDVSSGNTLTTDMLSVGSGGVLVGTFDSSSALFSLVAGTDASFSGVADLQTALIESETTFESTTAFLTISDQLTVWGLSTFQGDVTFDTTSFVTADRTQTNAATFTGANPALVDPNVVTIQSPNTGRNPLLVTTAGDVERLSVSGTGTVTIAGERNDMSGTFTTSSAGVHSVLGGSALAPSVANHFVGTSLRPWSSFVSDGSIELVPWGTTFVYINGDYGAALADLNDDSVVSYNATTSRWEDEEYDAALLFTLKLPAPSAADGRDSTVNWGDVPGQIKTITLFRTTTGATLAPQLYLEDAALPGGVSTLTEGGGIYQLGPFAAVGQSQLGSQPRSHTASIQLMWVPNSINGAYHPDSSFAVPSEGANDGSAAGSWVRIGGSNVVPTDSKTTVA